MIALVAGVLGGVLAVLAIFLVQLGKIPSARTTRLFNRLPGPRGLPFIGLGLRIARLSQLDVLDFFADNFKQFPRIMSFWILGMPNAALIEPEDIEAVMGNTTHISKGMEYEPLKPWLNSGLLLSTGEKWHRRRKLLTPAFHFRILEDSLQTFNKSSVILRNKLLSAKGEVDILSYAKRCTMDVICDSVMGVPMDTQNNQGEEYLDSIKTTCEIVIQREMSFWLYRDWTFNLSYSGYTFRKMVSILHKFTEEVIEERKKAYGMKKESVEAPPTKTRKAFLDLMIEYEANNPGSLSKKDIREEVDTFMFEGHDTTSSSLMFIFFCLATYPDVQEKVVQELYDLFGDSDRPVAMEDLPKMSYLEKVIKETMRMFPAVPYLSRYLQSDLKLKGGVVIPSHVNVVILPYLVHRNVEVYPDPERFDPERFSEDEVAKRHAFAYIPFSAGPRNCIGQKFAMIELKTITANVLRGARLETSTKMEDLRLASLLILKTNIPIMVKAVPRVTTSN